MLEQFLEEIGLTKSEISVYTALLELGSSSAGPIIETSKIAASKIYVVLEKLSQKGFVSTIESSGVRYFQAAPPQRIKEYLKEKAERISAQSKEIEKILPTLQYNSSVPKTKANIFKGIKGVQTALFAQLDAQPKTVSIRGNIQAGPTLEPLLQQFMRRCKQQKAELRVLSPNSVKSITSKKLFRQAPSITITFDKSVVLLPEYSKEPLAIVINAPDIAKSFQSEFDEEWSQEAKTMRGLDAIKFLCEEIIREGSCDWIGARGYSVDRMPEYFEDWQKRAKNADVKVRSLVDKEIKGHKITTFSVIKTKFTIEKEFASLSCFWIYKNKIAISNWSNKDEPLIIIIENQNICDLYKKQFESLWKRS